MLIKFIRSPIHALPGAPPNRPLSSQRPDAAKPPAVDVYNSPTAGHIPTILYHGNSWCKPAEAFSKGIRSRYPNPGLPHADADTRRVALYHHTLGEEEAASYAFRRGEEPPLGSPFISLSKDRKVAEEFALKKNPYRNSEETSHLFEVDGRVVEAMGVPLVDVSRVFKGQHMYPHEHEVAAFNLLPPESLVSATPMPAGPTIRNPNYRGKKGTPDE